MQKQEYVRLLRRLAKTTDSAEELQIMDRLAAECSEIQWAAIEDGSWLEFVDSATPTGSEP